MKHLTPTDTELREALERLSQKSPAPPAGMTERFMARLAQERTAVPTREKPRPTLAGRMSRYIGLSAVAAAAVIAFVLWPAEEAAVPDQPSRAKTENTAPSLPPPPAVTAPATAGSPLMARTEEAEAAPEMPVRTRPAVNVPPRQAQEKPSVSTRSSGATAAETPANETPKPAVPSLKSVEEKPLPGANAQQNPPVQSSRAAYTAEERLLDQQARLPQGRHDRLIIGEMLAVRRLSLQEQLYKLPAATHPRTPSKPQTTAI